MLSEVTLTRMQAYLDALPDGVESYPQYVQKASVYRQFLQEMPSRDLIGHLPPPVERLLTAPLPVSAWVPEVYATALYLAIADVHLPDEREFLAHKLEANRKILSSALYRILMMVVSPNVALRNTGARWRMFHRGIALATQELGPQRVEVRMTFPPHLVPPLLVRTYGLVFQATTETAGGKDVAVLVRSSDEGHADYEVTWR
jgi:uncharacterized protein (TIGR02265 family)